MSDYLTAHIGVDGFEYAIAHIGKSSTFADLEQVVRAQLAGGKEVTVRFEAIERITINVNPDTVAVVEIDITDHEADDHDGYTDAMVIQTARRGCVTCQGYADEIKTEQDYMDEQHARAYPTPEDDYWSAQSDRIAEHNRQ